MGPSASAPRARSATLSLPIMDSRIARVLASLDGASKAALTALHRHRLIFQPAPASPQGRQRLAWSLQQCPVHPMIKPPFRVWMTTLLVRPPTNVASLPSL